MRQSATRNGTYSDYQNRTSSSTGSVSFNNVARGKWYKASVTGCKGQSNCASSESGSVKVPPPPPPPTATPSGSLSAPAQVVQFGTTSVTASNLAPSGTWFKIAYPNKLREGTVCGTGGGTKLSDTTLFTRTFVKTTNFVFKGCNLGLHTLKLLKSTDTKDAKPLATTTINVVTPTPTPTPTPSSLTFGTSTIPAQFYNVGMSVTVELPTASGGYGPLSYTIEPPLGNGLRHSATTSFFIKGKPKNHTRTTAYSYKVSDGAGASTAIPFTITVFDVALKIGDQLLEDSEWSVFQHVTTTVRAAIHRPDGFQFRVNIPAGTGLQVNRKTCDRSATSTPTPWSRWFEGNGSFPLVRCGIGSAPAPKIEVWVKLEQNGTRTLLRTTTMTVPQSWHQADNNVTYYVLGTEGNKIRATSTLKYVGMFPVPDAGQAPSKLLTSSLSRYDNAAAAWAGVNSGATTTRVRSKASAEVLIRGYFNPATNEDRCGGSIACVEPNPPHGKYPHVSPRNTMWIEDPPRWPNRATSTWTMNYEDARTDPLDFDYLPAIILHEFGHPLGLGNSKDFDSIMSGSLKACSATNTQCVGSEDREALRAIYNHHNAHPPGN